MRHTPTRISDLDRLPDLGTLRKGAIGRIVQIPNARGVRAGTRCRDLLDVAQAVVIIDRAGLLSCGSSRHTDAFRYDGFDLGDESVRVVRDIGRRDGIGAAAR